MSSGFTKKPFVIKRPIVSSSITISNSSSSVNTFGFHALSEVIAELATEADNEQMLASFDDITYCTQHKQIQPRVFYSVKGTENHKNQDCFRCPLSHVKEINVSSLFQSTVTLEDSRRTWITNSSRDVDPFDIEATTQSSMNERECWCLYLLAVYQQGCKRRSKIQQAHQQAIQNNMLEVITITSMKQCSEFKELLKFDDELLQFFNDFSARTMRHNTLITGLHQKNMCKQFCKVHETLGDLVPYRPGYMYKACGICLMDKPIRSNDQQVVKIEREDSLGPFAKGVNNNNKNKSNSSNNNNNSNNSNNNMNIN